MEELTKRKLQMHKNLPKYPRAKDGQTTLFLERKVLNKLTANLPNNVHSQFLEWQYLTNRKFQKQKSLPKYAAATGGQTSPSFPRKI